MARKKITELPLDTAVVSTDVLPIVSDGATKRVQLATLSTFFAGATGPTGAAGVSVTGPTGPSGAAGASSWNDISGKPSTFPPSTHTHDFTEVTDDNTYTNFLTETGGTLHAALQGIDSAITARALASDFDQGLKTSDNVKFLSAAVATNEDQTKWLLSTDNASARLAVRGYYETELLASFAFELGASAGLVFNDSTKQTTAYTGKIGTTSGLVLKTGTDGVIEAMAQGTAGQVLVVNSGATAMEWKTLAAADVGASSLGHAHGEITSDGKVGSTAGLVLKTGTAGAVEALAQGTAGQVLKVNGTATGVEWGAAAADVSIDTTAADILSASSGSITADDPGADRLVFWDDSAGKLTHLTAGAGLSISGTTIAAANAVVSPSQITGNQNDYAPGAGDIVRLSSDAARNITGITAGSSGDVRVLVNVGSFTITLVHQSTSSTAANRFLVSFGADYLLAANAAAVIVYDSTTSRWRVI